MELGDYNDNLEYLHSARSRILTGGIHEGLAMLYSLKTHIFRTGDPKSMVYLLPNIKFYEDLGRSILNWPSWLVALTLKHRVLRALAHHIWNLTTVGRHNCAPALSARRQSPTIRAVIG